MKMLMLSSIDNVLIILFYYLGVCLSTPNSQKKGYGRPKSAEPGSPLLRRALSPDRLHPRSAETKTSISPLANTVVKVTPRVTIAQSSHIEVTDESNDSFKETNDAKSEKKVPSEQKADYSKLTHGISINLGNVGMSNSCGSTQLPRIAEEKDSPTGTKSDDYSSKEIGEKNDKQSTQDNQPGEKDHEDVHRDDKDQITADSKVSQCSKKDESIQSSISTNTRQVHCAITTLQKSLDQKHCQDREKSNASLPYKTHVLEQKTLSKSNIEAHQDGRKLLKKHKVEPSDSTGGAHSCMHENSASSGKDKNNQ